MRERIDGRTGFSDSSLEDINKCRMSLGLNPLKPHTRRCQKCKSLITNVRFHMFCEECHTQRNKYHIYMPTIVPCGRAYR